MTSQLCKCRSSPGSLCRRREKQRVLPGGPLLKLPPSPTADRSYQKAEERRPGSPGTRARPGQRQQRRLRSRTRAPAPTRARRLSIPPNSGVRHPSGRGGSLIGFHQRYRIKKKGKACTTTTAANRDRTHLCSPSCARETLRPAQVAPASASAVAGSAVCAAAAETAALGMGRLRARESWLLWAHTDLQVNEVGGSKERRTLLERPSACPRPPPPLDRMTPCV